MRDNEQLEFHREKFAEDQQLIFISLENMLRDNHMSNIFTDLPSNLPDELFTTLLKSASVHIERIVSHGHASAEDFWYDQDQHEWVVVLKGSARLRFEDAVIEMIPGDFVNIPAHRKHRVEWTTPDEPTIWLAVFYRD